MRKTQTNNDMYYTAVSNECGTVRFVSKNGKYYISLSDCRDRDDEQEISKELYELAKKEFDTGS